MAVLSDTDRGRVARGLRRYLQVIGNVANMIKADYRAAVNATDQWIEDNQTSYNNALPLPFRTTATLAQKTLLFCGVAAMRVGLDFIRQLFGEVD